MCESRKFIIKEKQLVKSDEESYNDNNLLYGYFIGGINHEMV